MASSLIPAPGEPVYLSHFFLEERRFPAVYFLYSDGVVVYVGQSRTLKWRIETHLQEGLKIFDAVAYIRCTTDLLLKIESHYIRKMAPQYNDCVLANSIRQKTPWRCLAAAREELDVSQSASYLGVSEDSIRQWREQRLLPGSIRVGLKRTRKEVWHWTRTCLNKFAADNPELYAQARKAA